MRGHVVGCQIREAFQFHRRLSTIKTDKGVAVAHSDIAMTLQITQGLAFQIKLIVAAYEVRDDVHAAAFMTYELEEVMARTTRHGGMA